MPGVRAIASPWLCLIGLLPLELWSRPVRMGSLDDLLRGQVARGVMRSLSRDLTQQLRWNGRTVPPWAAVVMAALQEASGEPLSPAVMSAIGRPVVTVGLAEARWVTTREAAQLTGRTERHIRRLASNGQVRARRIGKRTWQVDLDSLTNVLGRTA